MSDPIDVCIPLLGPRAAVQLGDCVHTMYERCRMEDVTLHLVVKEERQDLERMVNGIASAKGARVHRLMERIGELHGTRSQVVTNWVSDTAGTCQWCYDHCGDAPWFMLVHNDTVFNGDLFGLIRKYMTSEVGQVGQHSKGVVCYRRRAVAQCNVGWRSIAGFHVVKEHGNNKLRHGGDPRCTEQVLSILGFDIGEMLELNLCSKGWGLVPLSDKEWKDNLWHRMGGSDYHESVTTFEETMAP
jgi:hypothetical protein